MDRLVTHQRRPGFQQAADNILARLLLSLIYPAFDCFGGNEEKLCGVFCAEGVGCFVKQDFEALLG
jgi:hypothetical protein